MLLMGLLHAEEGWSPVPELLLVNAVHHPYAVATTTFTLVAQITVPHDLSPSGGAAAATPTFVSFSSRWRKNGGTEEQIAVHFQLSTLDSRKHVHVKIVNQLVYAWIPWAVVVFRSRNLLIPIWIIRSSPPIANTAATIIIFAVVVVVVVLVASDGVYDCLCISYNGGACRKSCTPTKCWRMYLMPFFCTTEYLFL